MVLSLELVSIKLNSSSSVGNSQELIEFAVEPSLLIIIIIIIIINLKGYTKGKIACTWCFP